MHLRNKGRVTVETQVTEYSRKIRKLSLLWMGNQGELSTGVRWGK